MSKFLVMVILKPDIKTSRLNSIQSGIINMFEQNTKVKQIWYLGKEKLDFKDKQYTEGIYIKLDIASNSKKVEKLRTELRKNRDILSSIIMNNDSEKKSRLPNLKMRKFPFYKNIPINNILVANNGKKIYMLINKNIRLPFCESDIIAISESENKILEIANKKLQEYIYIIFL